jgi:hypothetical protein
MSVIVHKLFGKIHAKLTAFPGKSTLERMGVIWTCDSKIGIGIQYGILSGIQI